MFSSDELVFAWPIGKALVIVVVAFGILVYAAWAGTKRTLRSSGNHRFRPLQMPSHRSIRAATLHGSDDAKAS